MLVMILLDKPGLADKDHRHCQPHRSAWTMLLHLSNSILQHTVLWALHSPNHDSTNPMGKKHTNPVTLQQARR